MCTTNPQSMKAQPLVSSEIFEFYDFSEITFCENTLITLGDRPLRVCQGPSLRLLPATVSRSVAVKTAEENRIGVSRLACSIRQFSLGLQCSSDIRYMRVRVSICVQLSCSEIA